MPYNARKISLALMRHSRFRYTLIFLLLACCVNPVSAQLFETYGEFSINVGQRSGYSRSGENVIGGVAIGSFGVQCGIVALNIGAGPTYFPRYGSRENWSENIGLDLPVGINLRIPLHKHLLVIGNEISWLNGLWGPHIGLLFAGKWHYRGIFIRGTVSTGNNEISYFGAGLKMTLNHR